MASPDCDLSTDFLALPVSSAIVSEAFDMAVMNRLGITRGIYSSRFCENYNAVQD